ncbi:MAG TPA: alpha/beta hydrolase-fold protein [Candidatus Saccharimonadales bacterium]|nr:alpha/beta hydrolase-fold protein [Candidatus Saccharimonadales bacterium]
MPLVTKQNGARGHLLAASFALCVLISACAHQPSEPPKPIPAPVVRTNDSLHFAVSFPESARSGPASGRVLLFLSKKAGAEPRFGGGFFDLQPVYAIEVTNWAAGKVIDFSPEKFRSPTALAFPSPLERLERGTWYAQALFDLDRTSRDYNEGPGNLYSDPVRCELRGASGGTIELVAAHVITNTPPKDTEWIKYVEVRSKLLSDFYGHDTTLRASVTLPSSYRTNLQSRFPALYLIPGFGGRHLSAAGWITSSRGRKWVQGEVPLQMLRVVLDPDVPLGHSVFANSANNGPVGDALIQELIPEIERRFRAIPEPRARFVSGHSSGGWSSLWLQVSYPDIFGGCWSTSPDPVDFRAFQTMNIYEDRNGHWTREGYPRPVGRSRDQVKLTFPQLNLFEYVTGYGGQLDSFDAVFSQRKSDGNPRALMNKLTGAIDPDVSEHWKRYDIRLVLESQWPLLGPKLKGKLHIITGGWDTFYLNPAVELLRDFLKTTDYGGYVEILPGDHGSVLTAEVTARIEREIADQFQQGKPKN